MGTSALQGVVAAAVDEAVALGHSHLGPEHLLIAASERLSPPRAAVLARHGLTPAALRVDVGAVLGAPVQPPAPAASPARTARAERALAHAAVYGAATPDDLLVALLADDVAPRAVIGAVPERHAIALPALRAALVGAPAGPEVT